MKSYIGTVVSEELVLTRDWTTWEVVDGHYEPCTMNIYAEEVRDPAKRKLNHFRKGAKSSKKGGSIQKHDERGWAKQRKAKDQAKWLIHDQQLQMED